MKLCIECGTKLYNMYKDDDEWKFCPNEGCEKLLQSTKKYLIFNPT